MTRDDVHAAVLDVLGEPLGICLPSHYEQADRIADRAEARAASQEPPSAGPAPSVPVAPAAPPAGADARRAALPPSSDCRDYDGPTCAVLDVSHWQGEIDWTAVASSPVTHRGREFAPAVATIIRLGDGKDRDRKAVANLRGARDAGLLVGAYRYLRAEHGVERQIVLDGQILRESGVTLDLPLCPDLEGYPDPDGDGPREAHGAWQDVRRDVGPVSTADVLALTRAYLAASEQLTGLPGWLYTGAAWRDHVREPPAWTWGVPLWLAVGARGRIPGPWTLRDVRLWQYTARGRVRGIVGPVDLNRYLGTAEELRALAGAQRVG